MPWHRTLICTLKWKKNGYFGAVLGNFFLACGALKKKVSLRSHLISPNPHGRTYGTAPSSMRDPTGRSLACEPAWVSAAVAPRCMSARRVRGGGVVWFVWAGGTPCIFTLVPVSSHLRNRPLAHPGDLKRISQLITKQ